MKTKRIIPILMVLLMALWGSPHKAAAQIFAVRANALAACTATLNFGVEVALTDRWSLEERCSGTPCARRILPPRFVRRSSAPATGSTKTQIGPFVGAQLSHVNYLLGRRTRRYDGRAWGAGLSCGYSWMLSKRWSVAVEGGLGLFHTKDTRRDPTVSDWDDEYIYHSRRWTLAPSRLELSFAYLF